jgi:type I restriction enzyme S subunit
MSQLPSGWLYESINSIVEGGMIADGDWVESKDQDPNGKVRLTQLADVGDGEFRSRSDRWMNDEQASRLNVNYLQPGDLLMARMPDPLGRTCMVPENIGRAVTVVDVAIIRITRKDVNPKFVMWLLNSPSIRQQIEMLASGTTRRRITRKNLGTIDLPMPPFEEQNKIVELLEDLLSGLDAALADVKEAKAKAAQFRMSLLLSLMSPNYAGSSNDWTRTTLGNVCNLVAGKTPPSLESSIDGIDNSSRTVPFYKVGDLNLHSEFLCESRLYLSAKQVEDRKLFILPIGSVVFPKAGGAIATNKKRVISVPGPIDLNCMAAIPIQGTNPKYLSWWFQSINLSSYADGSILPQLSKGKMSEIPVDWPNLKLQEEIVLSLEKSLSKNSEAIKLAAVIEANSSSLRRSLLQAAFTGKLTNEVASV